mgnify:CR=1 FL=1
MDQSQRVLVAGTGKSGIAAAKLILNRGGEVVLYDGNTALDEKEIKARFEEGAKVNVVLGEIKRSDLLGVELCIISPGIPLTSPFVAVVDEARIPILGEVELAYQCSAGKLAAITGTNGKTTTTALTGAMVRKKYEETFVVGNIGEPFTAKAAEMTEDSVAVAEISSFQLETIMDFKPNVSVILNITPDHLDRHGTMETYTQIKECITMNQTEEDTVVLNFDDPILKEFGKKEGLKPKVIWFSSKESLKDGFFLKGEEIIYAKAGKETVLLNVKELQLLGQHNYENVMAAAAAAMTLGVSLEAIGEAAREFKPVEHRIEFVRERTGVRYYNDSKGTNPDAAIKGIQAMNRPTLLIGGGYDKQSTYEEWIQAFDGKVRFLVLIGDTKEKIAKAARSVGFNDIIMADNLKEAVQICHGKANAGDAVLLSPACASWDQFKSYEQRGELFKEYVRAL